MKSFKTAISVLVLLALVLAVGASIFSALTVSKVTEASEVKAVRVVKVENPHINGTGFKLYIIPRYKFFVLKPGESYEFTVFVKNNGNRSVVIMPKLVKPPMFAVSNLMFLRWVKVSPSKITLNAGKSTTLKFTVRIPKNAVKGDYGCEVALTNDTAPSPYPYGGKVYINSVRISVNVLVPPPIKIIPQYFATQVVSGSKTEFAIKVINTGNKCFSLNPMVKPPEYASTFAYLFNNSTVTISAPKVIPPHSSVIVKVTLHDMQPGHYTGRIFLNINDTNLSTYQQSVSLAVDVIKRPEKPYVKEFYVENAKYLNVSVAISSSCTNFSEIKLVSPNGSVIKPKKFEEDFTVYYTNQYPYSLTPVKERFYGNWSYKVGKAKRVYVFTVKNPEKGLWKVLVKSPYTVQVKILKSLS